MPGTGAPKLASDLPTLEPEICWPPASRSQGSWDFPVLSQRLRAVDRPAEGPVSPENLPQAGKPASRGPDRHIPPVGLLGAMTCSPITARTLPGIASGLAVLLPGKFHGWRNLIGYSPWGHKESDTTEQLCFRLGFLPDSPTRPGKPQGSESSGLSPELCSPNPPGLAGGTPASSSGKAARSPLLLHEPNRLKQPGLVAVWTPAEPRRAGCPAGHRLSVGTPPLPRPGPPLTPCSACRDDVARRPAASLAGQASPCLLSVASPPHSACHPFHRRGHRGSRNAELQTQSSLPGQLSSDPVSTAR